MTQATLTSTSNKPGILRALRNTLRNSQMIVLAILCVVPLLVITVWTASLLDGLHTDLVAVADVPITAVERLESATSQALLGGGILMLLTFLSALAIGIYLRMRTERQENQQLDQILNFVYEMDAGDLTARLGALPEEDPIFTRLAEALNVMTDGVHRMTREVKGATQGLTEAADQIMQATGRQIEAATQQDAVVAQTTATVNEVRATVTETAERAQNVAENAQASIDVSRTGEQAVADAIEGMHLIRRKVEDIADNLSLIHI